MGAPSGSGLSNPGALAELAAASGIADRVRFEPPASREKLADFYRAADLTIVPSYNESFGLVALESQACGTPVVAAAVGGLPTAVAAGISGELVAGHRTQAWTSVLADLLASPGRRATLAAGTRAHAEQFSWRHTADGLLVAYRLQRTGDDRLRWALMSTGTDPQPAAIEAIRLALGDSGLEFEEPKHGSFVANLPGRKRLKTACRLIVGARTCSA